MSPSNPKEGYWRRGSIDMDHYPAPPMSSPPPGYTVPPHPGGNCHQMTVPPPPGGWTPVPVNHLPPHTLHGADGAMQTIQTSRILIAQHPFITPVHAPCSVQGQCKTSSYGPT